ncbi:TPA: hypothetical protein DIC40_03220 [Patescibacteria group bacterium]|nr:hypothetical protein P148_SR1C00001G0393 [candidate division SR1 bacterium RAAC1_SR1_1]HCY20855.1 hypothetical protein [Candidatus Gracilibacteria bacterium]
MKTKMSVEKEPLPTENLSAKEWWWRLYYHGEVQISKKWYNTPNDFEKELPYEIIITDPITEDYPYYFKNRKFKSEFNEQKKDEKFGNGETLHVHVAKTLKTDTIALWTPVFEYIIKQIPAYIFDGNELFEEFFGIRVSKGNYTASKAYLASSVPYDNRLFKTQNQSFFDKYVLNRPSYKKKVFKKNRLTKKERIELLFPNKRTINSFTKDNVTVSIDIFANETSGVKKFITISKELGVPPSYVQLEDSVSVSIQKKNNNFDLIVIKEQETQPIMFFQSDKVTVIPFEGLDNHPIMEYLKKNIDIMELDIPHIIEKYLEENIPSKTEL